MTAILILSFAALASSTFLLMTWFLTTTLGQTVSTIISNGFRTALCQCGLGPQRSRYEIELFVWESDDNVVCRQCDVCQERKEWPPMDIADWMAEGIPRTPEADCECGEHCQCRLVRYNPTIHGYYYEEHA